MLALPGANHMRVSVEDHEPGEILRKLPDIVRQLMQLDAGALAGHACEHHDHEPDLHKALAPGEPDPLEQKFRHPVSLAMYRRAKAAAAERGRSMADAVNGYLSQIGAS
ncbi:MAG TPA: hypothetical protein PLU52_06490 [Opitutaceae bacterium]|nr:hypothetical protein [Opitutaceae bacterium]